jgi:hypothetical protein
MNDIANQSTKKTKPKKRRCFAIQNTDKICGAFLNSYNAKNICAACQHHFALMLTTPKIATQAEFNEQRGINNGG